MFFNDYVIIHKGSSWTLISVNQICETTTSLVELGPFHLFKIKELKGKGGAKQLLLEMNFLFLDF